MKILAKYITRQAVITLFFTIGVFTFVLLLARILRQLSEMLLNQQVGIEVVGYFLLLMTPNILSFSLPMAMLATTLLIFGRMSADNEVTAMRASGIGLGQVMAPVILLAALTSVVCLYINANVAPWCRFEFKTMFVRLGAERPMALLEEGAYIKDFPGYVIYVGQKDGNNIKDVMIYTLDDSNNVVSSLRAQSGVVSSKPAERKLLLDLHNVRGDLRDAKEPTNVHKIRPDTIAERYPIEMDLGKALRQAKSARQLPDFVFPELLREIRDLRSHGIYPAAALMEAHGRVSGAVACLAFTLIGIPLGIKTSRRETSIGIAISLGLALAFYFVTVLANTLKGHPALYPEIILWSPNLFFEILGLWLLWRVTRA
ncbi:MAG TPA: LptF/LptG family permease [Verrucomicrobiae bacterium]|nr:LptF/LptG family permease [Verrucomicrobiae bacterium]